MGRHETRWQLSARYYTGSTDLSRRRLDDSIPGDDFFVSCNSALSLRLIDEAHSGGRISIGNRDLDPEGRVLLA